MIRGRNRMTTEISFNTETKLELVDVYYAQFFKHRRLIKGLTLEELAKITKYSISYISKFENCQLIPQKILLHKLSELYDIELSLDDFVRIQNIIQKVLRVYINENTEELKRMCDEMERYPFVLQTSLVKCFYYLQTNDLSTFRDEMKIINPIINNATNYEKTLCVLLCNEYSINVYQMEDVEKNFEMLRECDKTNLVIKWMIDYQKFKVAYHQRNYATMTRMYVSAIGEHLLVVPMKKQVTLQLMMTDLFFENNEVTVDPEVVESNYSQLFQMYGNDILYFKYLSYISKQQYVLVMREIIDQNIFCDSQIIALLSYATFMLNDEKYKKQFMKIFQNHFYEKNEEMHKKFTMIIISLIQLPKLRSEEMFMIKEEIKNFLKTYTHHFYSFALEEVYLNLLNKHSMYKTAVKFLLQKRKK